MRDVVHKEAQTEKAYSEFRRLSDQCLNIFVLIIIVTYPLVVYLGLRSYFLLGTFHLHFGVHSLVTLFDLCPQMTMFHTSPINQYRSR